MTDRFFPEKASPLGDRTLGKPIEAEGMYQSLFESSHLVMLIIDPESGAIADASLAASRYYGYERDELRQMNIMEINTLSPAQIRENMRKAKREERCSFHFQHRLKNGQVKDVEVYSGPIILGGREYLYSIVRDITEQLTAKAALAESEEKYRLLVENATEAIFIAQDGCLKFPNPKTLEILGRQEAEIFQVPFTEFIHPEDRQKVVEMNQRRLAGDDTVPETYSFRVIGKSGAEYTVELNAVKITWEGRPATLNFVRDISEQKELETCLYQAQKMEAIGTLAGGIAHDFNNLLMGIQGRTSLMASALDPNDPNLEHVSGIEGYVGRATNLTRQLLDFARRGKYEAVPTDMNKVVRESARMFGRTKKEIQIREVYEKNLWTTEVDRRQIEQVLLNLFVNAWQAMPGGGELFLQTESVLLDERGSSQYQVSPGRYVKISVTDTGVGMAEAILERIFDPFFTTKEMGRGTGLGLASAYGIVKNHKGFINVSSERGRGSTFTVYLPASESAMRQEERRPSKSVPGSETVLLVDDEQIVIEVVKPMLERLGYQVLSAAGGREAIELFRRNKGKVDLVILDLIMPDVPGGKVFDHMKEIDPEVRVLLASGYSQEGQAEQILRRGCLGFIQKPFTMETLSKKIRRILQF
jgi:PAS domain S-box-containing protein